MECCPFLFSYTGRFGRRQETQKFDFGKKLAGDLGSFLIN